MYVCMGVCVGALSWLSLFRDMSAWYIHSYLGFTDLPLTDIGSKGQNLQQPTHFVYMSIITRVPYYSMELLYYSVYL